MVGENVATGLGAVGVQAQKRERPGSWRREFLDDGKRSLEQCPRPCAARWIDIVPCAFGQCPKGPAMTVFRALLFQPSAVVAHKISKPAGVRVPGMLDERCKVRSDRFCQLHFAAIDQQV